MNFSFAGIIGSLIFSSIGMVAFTYGKRTANMRLVIQGIVLMAYTYVVPNTLAMYAIGAGLTAWAWLTRND